MKRWLRGAGLAALAALAFLVTAAAIRACMPWPTEGALDARWRWFRAHAADYDLVFVGSSHVARGVDPAVFDRALASRGIPLRSYVLAADNMHPAEVSHLLRQLVGLRAPHLRTVVMDLLEFAPSGMLSRNAWSDRAVYWHDAAGALDAVLRVAASDEPRREKVRLAWRHLRHAAWRVSSLGRAERALRAPPPDPAALAVAAAGGFEPLDARPDPASLAVRKRFLAATPAYLVRLEDVDRRNRVPALPPPAVVATVRAQTAFLRAAGIEPIYVVPPIGAPAPELLAVAREAGAPALVSLDSPARFPDLFDPAHRWDGSHLNSVGAALASERLAAELAPRLSPRGRE